MAVHTSVELPAPQCSVSADDVAVIIPTYNAARHWQTLIGGLDLQGLRAHQILIIDSSSTDNTRDLAAEAGYKVICIPKEAFNHGATRQLASASLLDHSYLVFMTQDVALASADSIQRLCDAFDNPAVGVAYGRQLPRTHADPIEKHGRIFNYPPSGEIRNLDSRAEHGFRTVFCSNSFAAYRRSALDSVGGFPLNTIVSEEVTVVARMLLAGWKIAYSAKAEVIHSHPLRFAEEFSRYFDIGVHHGREPWILQKFGGASGDGLKFVKSQLTFLRHDRPTWLPYAMVRMLGKFVAYHLGKNEKKLPRFLTLKLSGHPIYWKQMDARVQQGSDGRISSLLSSREHPKH